MKVTFPHMGNTYIAIKVLLEELGVEVVIPPKCSKNTLNIGSKYSPEQICMPFKINMGNFIESIQKGADTIIMLGGCDVCRFGLYHSVQKDILSDLGYNLEMICVEPLGSYQEIKDFLHKLAKVAGTKNYFKIFSAFKKGVSILFALDEFSGLANKMRAREVRQGETDKAAAKFEESLCRAKGYAETLEVIRESRQALESIATDADKDILHIGIVGEIYTVVEPFINMYLERKLGAMGVEVHSSITAGEFLKEELDFLPFIHSEKAEVYKAARPYLDKQIGGHARHTIGNTVRYSANNFDGVIHLLPFTCMPEIVAMSILPTIAKEKNIPVLTLVVDEMTGEGGYLTRLEAFVDALWQRKELLSHSPDL